MFQRPEDTNAVGIGVGAGERAQVKNVGVIAGKNDSVTTSRANKRAHGRKSRRCRQCQSPLLLNRTAA